MLLKNWHLIHITKQKKMREEAEGKEKKEK